MTTTTTTTSAHLRDDAHRDYLEDARDRCADLISAMFAEVIFCADSAELAVAVGLFAADERSGGTGKALMNLLASCGPLPANQASPSYSHTRAALAGRLAAQCEAR